MVKINWTRSATKDLKDIYDYIARDSKLYAARVIRKINSRANSISKNPHIGRVVPELNDKTIREIIEGNFRIIYSLRSLELIYILRIHHSSKLLTQL